KPAPAPAKPTAAPTSAPATVAATAGNELRIDVTGDPLSLDPLRFNGFSIQRVYRLIYNQLLKWNEDGTITPDLAAAMPTISGDGLTYTFKLRKASSGRTVRTSSACPRGAPQPIRPGPLQGVR